MKRIKLWFLNLILKSVSKLEVSVYHFTNAEWVHRIRREYQTLNYGYSEYDEDIPKEIVEERAEEDSDYRTPFTAADL